MAKMSDVPQKLIQIAEYFAEEIRNGKWDNSYNKCLPVGASSKIIEELERRAPNFTVRQYRDAIALGLQNTR